MAESKERSPLLVLAGVVLVATLLSVWIRSGANAEKRGGLEPGNRMPPVAAYAWLNGPAPTAESLQGKVLVIDAWATWCVPCRMAAPELVALHKKFSERGVVFIGLTAEGPDDLPEIQSFLSSTGITWLNGYGARNTLIDLKADYIPGMWVVDKSGTITWNRDSGESIEEAIEKALASK
ncbi:MAG: TlpA family protein disulfide reductase [Planctomycetaceae bacterium]